MHLGSGIFHTQHPLDGAILVGSLNSLYILPGLDLLEYCYPTGILVHHLVQQFHFILQFEKDILFGVLYSISHLYSGGFTEISL